jgi:hypothetical protein
VTLSVTQAGGNQAPTVSSIAYVSVSQGAAAQNIDLKTKFVDTEDGVNLTFSANSSDPGVVNPSVSNGVLKLTFGTSGSATVTATTKDSGNISETGQPDDRRY